MNIEVIKYGKSSLKTNQKNQISIWNIRTYFTLDSSVERISAKDYLYFSSMNKMIYYNQSSSFL